MTVLDPHGHEEIDAVIK